MVRRLALAAVIVLAALLLRAMAGRLADGFTIGRTAPLTSGLDGFRYRVHLSHAEAQRAADLLAALNARVVALLRALRARYVRGADGAAFPARRAAAERLLARYNPDNLAENSPRDPSGDTAYSLDKGAIVAICLRRRPLRRKAERSPPAWLAQLAAKHSGELHDLGTLTFVTLHEMAHIAVDITGHEVPFWRAFKFLLLEAEAAGVYRSPDYAQAPVDYCGVVVDYSPRWDPATEPL